MSQHDKFHELLQEIIRCVECTIDMKNKQMI